MQFQYTLTLAIAATTVAFQDTIYTLLNDAGGTEILAMAIDPNSGKVSSPTLTSAGGIGLRGLEVGPPFGARGSTAGPDSLFGQSAVVVSGNVGVLPFYSSHQCRSSPPLVPLLCQPR